MKPNISITKEFLSIAETIRGTIIISCKENENFKTLEKEQAIKYISFLKTASFNYDNSSTNISNFKSDILKNLMNTSNKSNEENTLKMILEIQIIIMNYLRNIKN